MPRIDITKVLALLVLFVFLVAESPRTAEIEDSQFKVRQVQFNGVKNVPKQELAESLSVQSPSFWKFWEPYPISTLQDLENDLLRIKQFYRSLGYYQTTVSFDQKPVVNHVSGPEYKRPDGQADTDASAESDMDVEYDVVFQIIEGPPVIVQQIHLNCLCDIEIITKQQLRKRLPIKPGDIFKTADYDGAKLIFKKILGDKGYPFATVSGNATVDLNDNSANITFDIDIGQLYRFGDIRITGHEDFVYEEVIRRAITFKSGEKFATKNIDESRRNLFDLNIFKTAVVKTGEKETENRTVPIDIFVRPRKKQSVKFGVGYGTDDGLRLQAAWSYRNLTGRADRLTLRARRSDIVENVYAEYLLPYFLSAKNNLVSTAGLEREEKDYYTLQRTSAEVNFYRKLETHWFATFGYNLEINRPEDIRVEDSEGVIDPRDTESYLVSSVKFNIERNTVDDVLNSKKGSAVGFSIENASNYVGSEISYIRPSIEAKVFVPIFWDMVLAGRMDYRTIQKSRDTDYIPISRQFFLGGSKSVRGFGFEKLGVIDENDVILDVSGLSSFIGNIELRFPIYKDFGGVVFLDTGALYTNAFKIDVSSLRYTSGIGLRYDTIIGPIQLDFGYQLNPPKSTASDDPLLTDLLNNDQWYIHFNIGQTF